jgi:glucosyl-3-phosphoglycerate phosphatase
MAGGAARLVLIRHGETSWNRDGRFQGHGGSGLNERGVEQAERTAAYLTRVLPEVAYIARSDLQRVEETAAYMERRMRAAEVLVDKRLREIDVGWWSGKLRSEISEQDPDVAAWVRGEDVRRGGGETFADLRTRVCEVVDELFGRLEDGETGIVFTHGGPIRVAVTAALGLPAGAERRLEPVANCALSALHRHAGRVSLAVDNSVGHLTDPRLKH